MSCPGQAERPQKHQWSTAPAFIWVSRGIPSQNEHCLTCVYCWSSQGLQDYPCTLVSLTAGAVELLASDVSVLNTVNKPLPFAVSAAEEKEAAREEVRLRHRVLDLR